LEYSYAAGSAEAMSMGLAICLNNEGITVPKIKNPALSMINHNKTMPIRNTKGIGHKKLKTPRPFVGNHRRIAPNTPSGKQSSSHNQPFLK